jgi:hypothetical protein
MNTVDIGLHSGFDIIHGHDVPAEQICTECTRSMLQSVARQKDFKKVADQRNRRAECVFVSLCQSREFDILCSSIEVLRLLDKLRGSEKLTQIFFLHPSSQHTRLLIHIILCTSRRER